MQHCWHGMLSTLRKTCIKEGADLSKHQSIRAAYQLHATDKLWHATRHMAIAKWCLVIVGSALALSSQLTHITGYLLDVQGLGTSQDVPRYGLSGLHIMFHAGLLAWA